MHLPTFASALSEEDFKVALGEWISEELPEVRKRDTTLPLEPRNIVAVLGPRRAGKTSLLYYTISSYLKKGVPRRNILYIDFEHPRLKNLKAENLDSMLKSFYELSKPDPAFPIYLFLDEIQNVSDYGKWFRKRVNARFYISGSSSKLSSMNVAEELRGRSVEYLVYPLSFKEFLLFKGLGVQEPELLLYNQRKRGVILSAMREYLRYGGYPAVVLERDEREKVRLLRSYFSSVVVRDFAYSNPALAEPFVKFLVQNYANLLSENRIYHYLRSLGFKVGKEKVLELFKTGIDSYFLFPLELFAKSERRRRLNLRKFYIVDTGYPTALGYEFSIGKAMENCVMLELRRREKEVFYWKEYGKTLGKEVDFVVSKNGNPQELLQVTYTGEGMHLREVSALHAAREEMGTKSLTLITWDEHGEKEDIKLVPLWYWLLK
jgi:predicted AAA+ superfamily ATPase